MKAFIEKKSLIEANNKKLSITRQCELLKVNRSSLYYTPSQESDLNLKLMRLMDEHYLKHPYKGAERMYKWLTMDKGYKVSLNRIERLYYKVMGLRSVLPGPHTSKRHKDHQVYPYLLRDLKIERNNQVWATDIPIFQWKKALCTLPLLLISKAGMSSTGHYPTAWMPNGAQKYWKILLPSMDNLR